MSARSDAWAGATSAFPMTARGYEPRWNLAFVGILAYLTIEYTRLPAVYPVLLPLQLGKVAIIISAVGLAFARRVRRSNLAASLPIDVTVAFLMLACLLSTFWARHQDLAWQGLADAVRCALIYFLISRIVNSPWRLRAFLFVFLLLNFKIAQFGLRTYGVEVAAYNEEIVAVRGVGAGSTGYFANSSDFGIAMDVAWAIAGVLLFALLKTKWRVLLVSIFLLFTIAILLCGSRGAVVGAGGIVAAAFVRNPRTRLAFPLMALILVLGVISVYPEASKERMRSALNWEQDPTASHRVMLWKAGMQMFADHTLVGVGPRNFGRVRRDNYPIPNPRVQNLASVAHSTYVEALTETGLLGSVPLVLLGCFFFRLNSRTRKTLLAIGAEQRRSLEYCLSLGLDLALVGYLVAGAFASVLWYPHLWLLLGFSVALHSVASQKQQQEDTSRVRPPVAPGLWLQTSPR